MTRTRRLALLAIFVFAALGHTSAAEGAMTARVTPQNTVLLTGDGADDEVAIEDGIYDPGSGNDYAVSMYVPDGGSSVAPGDGCIQGGPPAMRTYCGASTVDRMDVQLGSGDDNIQGESFEWDILEEIVVDLGGGDDKLGGTMMDLRITVGGGAGEDDIRADNRAATVDGGPDNDYLQGGSSGDTLRGGAGNDQILGLSGDDAISGEAGADSLIGGDNNDTIDGGTGMDNVQGDASSNVGQGNDTILVDDGERDTVDCAAGGDTVNADQLDIVDSAGCEVVNRSGGGGPGGTTPGGVVGTPPGPDPRPRRTTQPDETAPSFTAAPRLARAAFRAATGGAMIAQATRGTTLSLSLSEAARLRFTVLRRVTGRRVRGRCVARRPSNRRARRCTRQTAVRGTVTKSVAAGAQRLRFTGRVAGRALRPGRYVLSIVAEDAAGNASRARTVSFRIVR